MAQTDGEKELVLGNKQLIGLFFVVVALCGVFFAMGYMIGRNTARPASAALDGSPAVAAAVPHSAESEPPSETASAETPAPADTVSPRADPLTTPAVTQAAHDVPVQPASQADVSAPEPGAAYLQVTALRRADADNLVKTLREQNFPALLAASSKSDLFRVVVGPYHQTRQIAEARARLKSLGFANAFVQK